jgi:hypothetical protein
MTTYNVVIVLPLSEISVSLKEFFERLNTSVAEAGFDQKIQVTTDLQYGILTAGRPLKYDERKKVQEIMTDQMQKITALSGKVFSVELRRKSFSKSNS